MFIHFQRNLIFVVLLLFAHTIQGEPPIPYDNLSYPVLILGKDAASGFYLQDEFRFYLVTAKHVLFAKDMTLKTPSIRCISYSSDPNETQKIILTIDLEKSNKQQKVIYHDTQDVVLVNIANASPGKDSDFDLKFEAFVKKSGNTKASIVGASTGHLKIFDDVLVANDVFLFGYPRSLGIQQIPQFDYERPLLRKGIVAGKNENKHTIIIDCPSYPGNSGGPVVQVEQVSFTRREFKIIGIVKEFIPFTQKWYNIRYGTSYAEITNSGYTVVVSMDYVNELLANQKKLEKQGTGQKTQSEDSNN